MPYVESLHVHPVKGCAPVDVDRLDVDEEGPRLDREWMIVDEAGVFVTQRQQPELARVGVEVDIDARELRLRFDGSDPIALPIDGSSGPRRPVRVWLDTLDAFDAGDAVARWLSERIGSSLRLVRKAEDARRAVPPKFSPKPAATRFTDAFPLLVIGDGSLRLLGDRLGARVEARRFRPNIVVADCPPHAEDEWRRIRVGAAQSGIELAFGKLCSRCGVPNVDPETGERDARGEPLATLARHRTFELDHGDGFVERAAFFGANYVHLGTGVLDVGAPVEVLERA